MPKFSKKSLSLFLRNGCPRQFVFSLYNDKERETHGLPPRQTTRFALGLIGKAGYEWQDEKVSEIKDVFNEANVKVSSLTRGKRPMELDLLAELSSVSENQFIVEGKYQADTATFRTALGIGTFKDFFDNEVRIGETIPDIIQVLPPLSKVGITSSGTSRNPYEFAVLPDGETKQLDASDSRLRLRVIDVKLTSEPGSYYFAETVYYSMTLAAWLIENKLDDRFVVIAAPAIWAGSHQSSNLAKQIEEWRKKAYVATAAEKCEVLENDLDIAPVEVFASPLRRLLTEQLPEMLAKDWRELELHVHYRCKGCEFLGYPWKDKNGNVDNHPSQCWPTAEANGHLSQVVGLSRGATKYLKSHNITDVSMLAATNAASPVFDEHLSLRAKRSIYPFRADTLGKKVSAVIPHSGGDGLMPRYPDFHIYVFLDYDLSSAITAAISVRAFWREPLPFGSTLTPKTEQWTATKGADEVFLVDSRDLPREQHEFLKFLRHLKGILRQVARIDEADVADGRRDNKTASSRYQIYLWDESQKEHLVRLIGRHLPQILADPDLRGLAWLFPPPELLQTAEDATRQSPITIVSTVINNTLTVPVPHHYALLDVVKNYLPSGINPPEVHPLYEEPFSDLIPAERIHQWWQRIGDFHETQTTIRETSRKKVLALDFVTQRLETDLKDKLSRLAAPPVVRPLRASNGLAPQSQIWLEYTRLNNAVESFEVHSNLSMPPHEREARGKAARLKRRLSGAEENHALELLGKSIGKILVADSSLFVYEMRPGSLEVNARPGDIGYALAPEMTAETPRKPFYNFLDEHPYNYVKGTTLENWGKRKSSESFETLKLTEVSIEAIDRINGFIALRAGSNCIIPQLEIESNIPLDFSRDVVLDRIHSDYLTKKVKLTLEGIGYPASAVPNARMIEALEAPVTSASGTDAPSPAGEVLWEAPQVQSQFTKRDAAAIKPFVQDFLNSRNVKLDPSQWRAWEEALSRRFSLLWGPPGTGKSRTLRAVVLGAVQDATENKRTLRLLITANTNTALENVMLDAERELVAMFPHKPFKIYRVQSHWQDISPEISANHPDLIQLTLSRTNPSPEVKDLIGELKDPTEITIVGCLPQQLHNLAVLIPATARLCSCCGRQPTIVISVGSFNSPIKSLTSGDGFVLLKVN